MQRVRLGSEKSFFNHHSERRMHSFPALSVRLALLSLSFVILCHVIAYTAQLTRVDGCGKRKRGKKKNQSSRFRFWSDDVVGEDEIDMAFFSIIVLNSEISSRSV